MFSSNGGFDVSLTVTNSYGCSNSITVSSNVNVGIEDLHSDLQFKLFPNPASDWIELAVFSDVNRKVDFRIVDVFGRTVHSEQANLFAGVNQNRFDLRQLAEGAYVLTIRADRGERSTPFVVTKR